MQKDIKEMLDIYGLSEKELTKAQMRELKNEVATIKRGGHIAGGVLQTVSPYKSKFKKK